LRPGTPEPVLLLDALARRLKDHPGHVRTWREKVRIRTRKDTYLKKELTVVRPRLAIVARDGVVRGLRELGRALVDTGNLRNNEYGSVLIRTNPVLELTALVTEPPIPAAGFWVTTLSALT
jgi:hypothetical protein